MKTGKSNSEARTVALRHFHLRVAGIEGAEIARRIKVSPAAVSMVMNGHRRSRRIEDAISTATKQPHSTLWPS